MSEKKITDIYDDGNIPESDLPRDSSKNTSGTFSKTGNPNVEPLPESTRPRKDGPGGN